MSAEHDPPLQLDFSTAQRIDRAAARLAGLAPEDLTATGGYLAQAATSSTATVERDLIATGATTVVLTAPDAEHGLDPVVAVRVLALSLVVVPLTMAVLRARGWQFAAREAEIAGVAAAWTIVATEAPAGVDTSGWDPEYERLDHLTRSLHQRD